MTDLSYSQIAEICHEANRALCAAFGDHSQLPWEHAPDWQRQSARRGVLFVIDNPNSTTSATHDAWMEDKLAAGWVWGPVKDAEAMTHPCLVPFKELPPEQQAKDHIFAAIVRTITK